MPITDDLSKFARIANASYNSISANATAVTCMCVTGNVNATVVCGTTGVCSPSVCASTAVNSPSVCGTTSVCSPTVCGSTLVTSPSVCGTTSITSPSVCGTTSVCSPTLCASTTVSSPVICATSCVSVPTVCATNLYGNGAALSGIATGPTYVCMIACSNLCSGDPVVNCGTCGVSTTTGFAPLCANAESETCCSYGCLALDAVAVPFLCSQSCFAVVTFKSAAVLGSTTSGGALSRNGYLSVNAFCVSPTGILSAATNICCYCVTSTSLCAGCTPSTPGPTCGWDTLPQKMIAIPSCSGSVATVMFCACRCFWSCFFCYGCLETRELKLCFCTTTNLISVISLCCGDTNTCYQRSHFITPDRNYFVTIQTCNANMSCTCATVDLSINVKCMTDATCYIGYPAATVTSGIAIKSILPATCVYICGWRSGTLSPFTYGPDKWMPVWVNVLRNNALSYCVCCDQRIFAFRPVGDNCIETSANQINPRTYAATPCIPYYYNTAAQCCLSSVGLIVRGFDQGDCIKRIMWMFCNGSSSNNRYLCFKVCTGNQLCFIGYTDTTSGVNACQYVGNIFKICSYGVGGYGLLGDSVSTTIYYSTYPSCYLCSCYYSVTSLRNLYGDGADIFGNAGCCYCCDNGCAYVINFQYCQNTTCWTDLCNFYPINNVCCVLYTLRQYSTCCGRVKPYNYQPFLLQSNTVMVAAGTGIAPTISSLIYGAGGTNPVINPYVVVYNTNTLNNVCCFLGIVQNTVNTGSIACIAVPGMIDRSCFATRFFTSCPYNCQTICLGASCSCFASVTTETDTYLGQGFSACGNFLNYQGDFVTLRRYYDCYSNTATTVIGTKRNCIG